MYLEHFGLNAPPFKITPDPQLFYTGGERGLVLEALVYALLQGEGMVKVVGEVGSGKTMLCRMLPEKLPNRVEILYLANPRLTPDTILQAIALEMRLPIAQQQEPKPNHLQVMQALHEALLEKHAKNQQVVLLIEEAQGMPLDTLEEIRLLSNLETTRHKLLQIVLFGQPELEQNLANQSIRQLRERITHSFYLTPLSRSGVAEYLNFRMRAVGYRGPSVFAPAAIKQLHRHAQGLLRRTNILADKALLAAFSDNTHQILAKHVRRAVQDSGFLQAQSSLWRWLIFGVALLLSASAIFLLPQQLPDNFFQKFALPAAPVQQIVASPPASTADHSSPALPAVEPAAASPALPPPSTPSSVLQQRLLASRDWLQQAPDTAYTIQLMHLDSDKNGIINNSLAQESMQDLQAHLYLLPNTTQVSRWRLFYGEFASYTEAQAELQRLPPTVRDNQPFVRRIQTLQKSAATLDWEELLEMPH